MKSLFCIFIFGCFSFQILLADQKTDNEAIAIRKQINEIKVKKYKVELSKKSILELQEDMLGSAVIDADTIKMIEEANQIIEMVSKEDVTLANHALLSAEINVGVKRASDVKLAFMHLNNANEKLDKVKNLLALKASKAQLIEKIIEQIKQSKSCNLSLVCFLEKELSGEKLNFDIFSELSLKQNHISKSITLIHGDVLNLISKSIEITDKELFGKVLGVIVEESLIDTSKRAEKNIEDKNLMISDVEQKRIVLTLEKMLKTLRPEEVVGKTTDKDNGVNGDLSILLTKIEKQNTNIETAAEGNIGNADLTRDPKYDNTVSAQRNINREIKSLLDRPGLDPKIKDKLTDAQTSLRQSSNDLENADPAKAVQLNQSAAQAIKNAIADTNKKNHPKNKEGKPSASDTQVMSKAEVSKFEESKVKPAASEMMKIIIRANQEALGEEPTEKEVWQLANTEKSNAVLFQNLISKAPKEYAEPTQKYFVAIADIGE